MSVRLRDRTELQRGKHKRRTTSDQPFSDELLRQYFHVQRLRQQLRIAESEQIAGLESTGSAEPAGPRKIFASTGSPTICVSLF